MIHKYTWAEATTAYNTRILLYGNKAQVKQYSKTLYRLKKGMEQDKVKELTPTEKQTPKTHENRDIRDDSISRTMQKAEVIIECNKELWKTFITLTFKDNITDLTDANKEFNKWTKSILRVKKDFKYFCVPEFQKRGAVHYHMFTNLDVDTELIPKREVKELYNSEKKSTTKLEYYDIKYWNNGFSSAFDIVNGVDENFKLVSYMAKYMYKDIDNRLFARKKILYSQGLKKGKEILLMQDTKDYDLAMQELERYEKTKEKDILSAKKYVPNIKLKEYNLAKIV